MSELFPISSLFLYPNFTRVNVYFDFFYMIHNGFAIIHRKKDGLHFNGFKVFLNELIDFTDISRAPKYPELGVFDKQEYIIIQQIPLIIKIHIIAFSVHC